MFSALEARDAIDSARVVDLYAGSGALGLEALSRGANSVVLVEQSPAAAAVAKTNAKVVTEAIDLPAEQVRVVTEPVNTFLASAPDASADLVLIDPPYELSATELNEQLSQIARMCTRDAIVVIERSDRSEAPAWPECFSQFGEKHYGDTVVWWARANTELD